ncbi:hypothetical protein JY97_00125 [Alkalispirochaeta odontotermitis]|nr:hypothetical protein JY97_00125 [Alkalispirochaeta odontotermitis]CAB1081992.1 hypothetical protein D1AOALGA4SA_9632 [Olavius algarvensis Delta 1 endosymbiont]
MSRSVTIARIHLESIEFYRHPATERLEKILENIDLFIAGQRAELAASCGISETVNRHRKGTRNG